MRKAVNSSSRHMKVRTTINRAREPIREKSVVCGKRDNEACCSYSVGLYEDLISAQNGCMLASRQPKHTWARVINNPAYCNVTHRPRSRVFKKPSIRALRYRRRIDTISTNQNQIDTINSRFSFSQKTIRSVQS